MATRVFAQHKLEFARELSDVLAAAWGVELALHLKVECGLSDRRYQSLRLAFCKEYTSGRWQKRVWYCCPTTGATLYLPQPLVSRYFWFAAWRDYIRKYELSCDADGKVAGRGFLQLLRQMVVRELDLSTLRVKTSAQQPWHPCFHLDGAAISNKRSFTHAGLLLPLLLSCSMYACIGIQ
eukprot:4345318-Pleurochrysis_carterae.AAC.2